jgi:hypothetical protein
VKAENEVSLCSVRGPPKNVTAISGPRSTSTIEVYISTKMIVCLGSAASNLPFLGKVYTPPINVPAPLAFFPLTEGQGDEVSSYPYPEYAGGPNGTSLR